MGEDDEIMKDPYITKCLFSSDDDFIFSCTMMITWRRRRSFLSKRGKLFFKREKHSTGQSRTWERLWMWLWIREHKKREELRNSRRQKEMKTPNPKRRSIIAIIINKIILYFFVCVSLTKNKNQPILSLEPRQQTPVFKIN